MIVITLVFLGLALGSFVNALVWRLHEQDSIGRQNAASTSSGQAKRKTAKSTVKTKIAQLSILRGRSVCTHCRHQLAARDLVPVLSWLSLKGKCRYCRKPISAQYPVVEVLTAALLAFSYAYWPYFQTASLVGAENTGIILFGFWVLILPVLLGLAFYDLKWMELPDKLNTVLVSLVLLQIASLIIFAGGGFELLLTAALGALVLAGFFYILFQVSQGRWIGGGDVKLGVGLGLLAGSIAQSLLLLFVASSIGTIISLVLLAGNKVSRKTQVPFGPFLITGAIIVHIFGASFLEWYKNQLIII